MIEYGLISIAASFIFAYILHFLQKKRKSDKHLGDMIFISLCVVSIIVFFSSFFVGRWEGLALGVSSVFLFLASVCGFIFTNWLKWLDTLKESSNRG